MLMMALGRPHREAASAGGDATITHTDDDVSAATSSSFTFSTQSLGTADATRRIAVGVGTSRSGGSVATVSALTVAGVSASSIVAVNNGSEAASIWLADVPTGTTGDVVVTTAANSGATGIDVWAIYNAQGTATDSGTDSDSDPATFALDIAAGGVALGFVAHRSNTDPTTFTWTNLTEASDRAAVAANLYVTGAQAAFASTQTNLSIECDSSDAGVRSPLLVTASFPKT